MKLKARILSVIMAVAMIMSSMVIVTSAASDPTLTVTTDSATVVPGGTVTVKVNMANNPGIVSMRLELNYDNSVFTIADLTDVVDAGLLGTPVHNNSAAKHPYILSWQNGAAQNNFTVNGDLVAVTFQVADTAVAGETYDFSVSYDYDNTEIMNKALESVYFDTVDATVTVEEAPVIDDPDTNTVLSIESTNAKPGDTVDVVIKLAENPGIAVLGFDVDYDSTVFTLNSIQNGEIFSAVDGNTATVPVTLNDYNASNVTGSGVFATLTFTVNANAAEGDYNFTIKNLESYNQVYDDVIMRIVDGVVTVKNFVYGDLTGEGTVNRKDLLMLAQHFAGFDVSFNTDAADLNCDGTVNRKDLLVLAQHFAGFDVTLGK